MADTRKALVALLHNEGDGGIWEHFDRKNSEAVADAILAEFDVTERGVHNHDIDPACPETRLPDGSLRGACAISAMTAFDSPHGMWCPPGCGHDRSEAAVPSGTGVRERVWQALRESRRTGLGGMTEAQALDHMTDAVLAAVDQRVKPSEEDVARALADDWNPDRDPILTAMFRDYAQTVLALIPGRTEAEVYREGYDQGLRDAVSVSRSEAEVKIEALRWAASVAVADDEGIPWDDDHDRAAVSTWLLGLAARIEKGEGRG